MGLIVRIWPKWVAYIFSNGIMWGEAQGRVYMAANSVKMLESETPLLSTLGAG